MVVVYRGIQQDIGPIKLSEVYEETGIELDDLDEFTRQAVESTVSAGSLAEARAIVERLRATVEPQGVSP
jgi:protein phosphatase